MSPLLKTSSSGFDPASFIARAMVVMLFGELITADAPDHIVLRSRLQISGFSAKICSTRRIGFVSVVPGGSYLRVILARNKALAWASREIDNHIHATIANAVNDLSIVAELHARSAIRVAHVDVGNGCAGFGRFDTGGRDLLRRTG